MKRSNIDISFIIIVIILAYSSIQNGAFSDPKEWVISKVMLLPAIIIGLSMHEFAHAAVAYRLGDNTPKFQGRVTINPLAHIDWIGLLALFFCGFGWGKPVQINPYNFRHIRRDELLVALAGVVMNLLVAFVFALVTKVLFMTAGSTWLMESTLGSGILTILTYIVQINIILMMFNLIPCPPLDGFNIIAQIFNFGQTETYWRIYRIGNWLLIALIVFGIVNYILSPCVAFFMDIFWAIAL